MRGALCTNAEDYRTLFIIPEIGEGVKCQAYGAITASSSNPRVLTVQWQTCDIADLKNDKY